ncbi:MAG: hypothetical protein J6U20_04025 [Fibrobacter sp.]|nr:hypothetical protein [Fibrobacter sp.]
MPDEKRSATYKSRKSRSEFTVSGTKDRAFLAVTGEAATNPKVIKQVEDVRKGAYDFATVEWMARQVSSTY